MPRRGISTRHAVFVLALVLMGLIGIGRLAMEAWLNREVPQELPELGARTDVAAPFLMVILDGLREGTSWTQTEGPMPWHRRFAQRGAYGISITGEPTLTAPCVRTLLTGRRPDLLTAFRNFDAREVRGSLIEYLAKRGGRLAHAGDAAAWQICKRWYPLERTFQVADRGPVDQGETDAKAVPFLLEQIEAGCDVLTLHLTRIDHAGHKYGALGSEYAEACEIVDGQIQQVVEAFLAKQPEGTVLIASDHGVSSMGTHGGGERSARRAPYLLVGPGVPERAHIEVRQAALAPTVAALLGLPQPPLADAPPRLDLLDLPVSEAVEVRRAYLEARARVARQIAGDAVDRVERKRAEMALTRLVNEQGPWRDLASEINALLMPHRMRYALMALVLLCLWTLLFTRAAQPVPSASPGAWWVAAALGVGTLVVMGALPDPLAPTTTVAALLMLGGLAAASAVMGPPAIRHAAGVVALVAIVPVLTGVGYVMQEAFSLEGGDPGALPRLGVVGGLAVGLLVAFGRPKAWLAAARRIARDKPVLCLAVLGGLLGFGVTLRPFVDNLVHTLVLYAALASVCVVLYLRGAAMHDAPRKARSGVVGVAAVLFVVVRVVEGLVLEGVWVKQTTPKSLLWLGVGAALTPLVLWMVPRSAWRRENAWAIGSGLVLLALAYLVRVVGADTLEASFGKPVSRTLSIGINVAGLLALVLLWKRGTPDGRLLGRLLIALALARRLSVMDAEYAAFVLVAVGAAAASYGSIAVTRARIAWWALGLIALRTGVFHAMGFEESFSTLDVGQAFAGLGTTDSPDGAAAEGVTWQIIAASLQLALRMALPWILFLAALMRGMARTPGADERHLRLLVSDVWVAFAARGALVAAALWAWWRNTWWMSHAYTVYAYAIADVLLLAVVAALLGVFRGGTSDPAPAVAEAPEADLPSTSQPAPAG